jgi:hypothetical protein
MLLAPALYAQSSDTLKGFRLDAIDVAVKKLQAGRPTITGIPTFQGGASFTGASTFTASVLISSAVTISAPVSITTTSFTLGSSISDGWWVPYSSGTFVNISTLTITNLVSSATFRCELRTTIDTASKLLYAVWNQNGSSVFSSVALYNTAMYGFSNAALGNNSGVVKYLPLSNDAASPMGVAGGWFNTNIEFSTVYGTSVTIAGFAASTFQLSATVPAATTIGFMSKPLAATSITDLEIFPASTGEGAGSAKISGNFWCYKRQ